MKSISVFVIFGLSQLFFANSQSPCPNIFEYKYNDNGAYGVITLKPNGYKSTITIKASFTITAQLQSDYVGNIVPYGGTKAIQEYNRGKTISYKVNFPVSSPLPKLTELYVNNNLICSGDPDTIDTYDYVTTITLQHTMYIQSGPRITYQNGNKKPSTQTQVINYDNNGNRVITIPSKHFDSSSFVIDTDFPELQSIIFKNPQIQYVPSQVTRPAVQFVPEETPTTTERINRRPVSSINKAPPRASDGTEYDDISNLQCGKSSKGPVALLWYGQSFSRGAWPWVVALYQNKDHVVKFVCSGTLVSERHVISAAHCVYNKAVAEVLVKVGVYNLDEWGSDVLVRNLESAFVHENFNRGNLAHDITLLTMEQSVQFSKNIRPACLWGGNPDLERIVDQTGVVIGWGDNERGKGGHGEPRMIRLPIVSTTDCRANKSEFHRLTSDWTLCAGNRDGSGPCSGDSGGGLYILDDGRWKLRGIVSLTLDTNVSEKRCNLDEFVVFTDSAKYMPWIKKHMQL